MVWGKKRKITASPSLLDLGFRIPWQDMSVRSFSIMWTTYGVGFCLCYSHLEQNESYLLNILY